MCVFECMYICVSVGVGSCGVVEEYVQLCLHACVYTYKDRENLSYSSGSINLSV